MKPKIRFTNVSKGFNLYNKQSDKLMEVFSFKKNSDNFFALRNISFDIYEGETIGIVGLNGSGKSTLSNLLGQIIPPSSGEIEINGETSLIAISVGLNNQLSGLENIELKCLMHGLKQYEINELKSSIVEFADLGKFINQPVKNYSSGMKSRLGFAISIHTNPDILIVDEALSVGDQTFYEKCLRKINEFKSQGKTIIFISHSFSQIRQLCDRVIWIHFGEIKMFEEANKVVNEYKEFISWFNEQSENEKQEYKLRMLEQQYKDEGTSENNSMGRRKLRSRQKHKHNKFNSFTLQLIALIIAVMVGAVLNFDTKPSSSFEKDSNTTLVKTETSKSSNAGIGAENVTLEPINEIGIVINEDANYYKESNIESIIDYLPFGLKVNVEGKQGDYYKISDDNQRIGYINLGDISILEDDSQNSIVSLNDFIPLFPNHFSESYQYFLSFLNSEYEEVKSKVNGLTRESELEEGKKLLTYLDYSVDYIINKNDEAESMIVSNINIKTENWILLKQNTLVQSNDKRYFLFNTGQYNVTIDLLNNKAIISINK